MGARRGGETHQQNVIMHMVYCMKLSCTLKHVRLKLYFESKYTITVVSRNFKTFVSLSEYSLDCFTQI